MKISVVHSYYSSATPSGENFMVDSQVAALTEAGHDVQLIALRTDDLQRDLAVEPDVPGDVDGSAQLGGHGPEAVLPPGG